jgi:hypothetical protein
MAPKVGDTVKLKAKHHGVEAGTQGQVTAVHDSESFLAVGFGLEDGPLYVPADNCEPVGSPMPGGGPADPAGGPIAPPSTASDVSEFRTAWRRMQDLK